MAYSIDFRRKVIEIKERDGLSLEEAALRFSISESSVFRWSKCLEPCRIRNKPATNFHKSEIIQDFIEAAGGLLEFLPPYSPDLNPIEHKWAQAKARRRKLGCSVDDLFWQPDL